MRKYTALYTPKESKEAILQGYEAKDPKDAIEKAQKFDAWPNVAIYDDTYSAIPSYGEMIYLNGKIIKRSFDGPYLLKSLCRYDAIRTDLSYVSLRISNKILTITHILGLKYNMPTLTDNQKELYNNWIDARNNKEFEKADLLRNKLIDENIL